MTLPSNMRRFALAALCGAALVSGAGCEIVAVAGVMAESYKESSTRTVHADYTGLEDKTFMVLVAADRTVQASHPDLVARLTMLISNRLAQNAGASGYVPPAVVLEYQYNNPRWVAMGYEDIAEEFGVDRIVFVDLYEYRLHEPGNSYLWAGVAAATVGVVESDGPLASEFTYTSDVSVSFPDADGYGPADISEQLVQGELVRRFVDRAVWPFYEHQEPYYPDY